MRNSKNNGKYNLEFQIVSEENKPVLGASAIQGMELITVNMQNILTVDEFASRETLGYTVSQVVAQFKDVFEGEGMLMGKLHLQVDQCVPAVQLPACKPPVALKEKYQAELESLVEKGIIARVSEPTDWISSTVVVMKPNGKIRLCLDPRPLNEVLKRNHYPMPVAYASRSLTETDCNYVQMEKELLAIVFGVEKFESYLYGRKFKVETDYKPLDLILKKSLLSAPKHLQRMMLHLQNFDFEVEYKKGTLLHLADTLSRVYLLHGQIKCSKEDVFLTVNVRSPVEEEIEAVDALSFVSISPQGLDRVQRATEADSEMVLLKTVIQTGWPDTKEEVPVSIQGYFHFRDELSVQDGLVLKGERLVVPQSIREEIKQKLHQSHLGIQGCLRRGKEVVYWPGMNKDIEDFISSCSVCKSYQTDQQKEPMISHEIPSRPWEKVGCDLFDFEDKHYLVCVDYYSDYFEVDRIFGKKGKEVISRLKSQFARHGIPDQLISDNGPPFSSREFQEFALAYEFEHLTSSPRYPQSNGKVENAVKLLKIS